MMSPESSSLPSGSAVAPSARRSWQQSLTLALLAVSALLVYNRVTDHTTGVYLVDAQGHLRLVWDYTQVTTDAARIAQDLRAVMK
jgi:hypothetical protein